MKIYKEIKEIAKCNSKIERLTDRLSERFDVGEDIEWNTAIFVSMKDKDLKRLDLVSILFSFFRVILMMIIIATSMLGIWRMTFMDGSISKLMYLDSM